ncbi:NADH-quinone oxidoreductase subunit F [Amycolatopsis rubida]|uniref:NADH-quinone oxidoreductase subunit F n=1 Tax=Amycolatopsis rubida TaxID=112413 RepID=A0ABX0BZR2_9PSEU|nr:NADH-ubiquinone oxidoreductase-F iron-sulfur binding region domain-containing protein [Amycolatopsis rubida]MYW93226.1 NADH-quinone oxidoreductase subunit F [Amycolatopsis rubida]NEC58213.1 NADH-quinone oxidoreductase subunit F [Amycolatopsis rubida]
MLITPVLTRSWTGRRPWTLPSYLGHDGYTALAAARSMPPGEVIALVRAAGLRGRGGAGFPTAAKWGALPRDGVSRYLVVNANEAEPGACKDVPLLLANPHEVVEGALIAAHAIGARHVVVYLRGEVLPALRRLQHAVAEAARGGYLGTVSLVVHAGAGAYVCGEETALLQSLEGRRPQPSLRSPGERAAVLYGRPAVINNVETIARVPSIVRNGPAWFRSMGTEDSPGCTLFSLSGHLARPGQYEAPFGVTARELFSLAGGIRRGHRLKFWSPGGASAPVLTAGHLDVPLDHAGVAAAGSALGAAAVQVFDETTCVVRAVLRWAEFYAAESCGKCTPCRQGTGWLVRVLRDLERGAADASALGTLLTVSETITSASFCAFGAGSTGALTSSLTHFRDEYLAHVRLRGCPFDPAHSTRFAAAGAMR